MAAPTRSRSAWLLLMLAVLLAQAGAATVPLYGCFELELEGPADAPHADPTFNAFVDTTLTATVRCASSTTTVTGFYDGPNAPTSKTTTSTSTTSTTGGIYRVRFLASELGQCEMRTSSNVGALNNRSAEFEVVAADSGTHGPLRSVPGTRGFRYADGTPDSPLGTTSYAWWHSPADVAASYEAQTLASLGARPFTKLRSLVFPKYYPYTHVEPAQYPFPAVDGRPVVGPIPPSGWDFARFNVAYFQHLEQRIGDLQARGVLPELILFHPYDGGHWGFDRMNRNCPFGPTPRNASDNLWCNQHYIRYVAARFAALGVWFSMANEFNLMDALTVADFDVLFRTLAAAAPASEISIHQGGTAPHDYYNHSMPYITHISLQGHKVSQLDYAKATWTVKPIVWDEVQYEGNCTYGWGNLTGQVETLRGWLAFANGVHMCGHSNMVVLPAPYTTGDCSDPNHADCNAVTWWNRGRQMFGESPSRLGFLRDFIRRAEVPPFERLESDRPAANVTRLRDTRRTGGDGPWIMLMWTNSSAVAVQATPSAPTALATPEAGVLFEAVHVDVWATAATVLRQNIPSGSTITLQPPTGGLPADLPYVVAIRRQQR